MTALQEEKIMFSYGIILCQKEDRRYDKAAWKMCTENLNVQYKNNFHYFCQNNAVFYDKHILLTALCWNHAFLNYI